jgi:hypothetical protein
MLDEKAEDKQTAGQKQLVKNIMGVLQKKYIVSPRFDA